MTLTERLAGVPLPGKEPVAPEPTRPRLSERVAGVQGGKEPPPAVDGAPLNLSERVSGVQGGKSAPPDMPEASPMLSERVSGVQGGRKPAPEATEAAPMLSERVAGVQSARKPPEAITDQPQSFAAQVREIPLSAQPAEGEQSAPFGEWLPDLPVNANPGATVARNVIPRDGGSYGPLPDLSKYADALDNRAQGAFSIQDSGGNVNIFAGDDAKLYRIAAGSVVPQDVSRAAGYTTGSDERWVFSKFLDTIHATNFNDPIQIFEVGVSSLFSDHAATTPKARYGKIIENFYVLANLNDATDGLIPEGVHWSAFGNPEDFPVLGSADAAAKQSDRQELVGDGGWIMGIEGPLAAASGVIFQEREIWRMTFDGPPVTFSIKPVEGARGTPAPGSIISLGGLVYYLGIDGFYAFDGVNSKPIGVGKVDNFFFRDVDQSSMYRISAGVDPVGRTVCWAYPGSGSTQGTPNRILIYKWDINQWSLGEIETEILLPTQTFGQTLEDLDAFGDLDSLPASLDSRIWTGGASAFAAFNTLHELSYFSGAPLEATIETGEFDGSGRRVIINGLRPIGDGGTPSASVGYRDTPQGALTYTPPTTPQVNGICDQRVDARYARARVRIPAGSGWRQYSRVAIRTKQTTQQ